MLRSVIDRTAVARALARAQDSRGPESRAATVGRALPTFGPDGTRVGDPRELLLDWSRFPHEYIEGPGAAAALHRGCLAYSQRPFASYRRDRL